VVAQQVIFGILAATIALAAIGVVTAKNVVHAALYLVVVLAGVAAIYVMVAAEFTAVVQVLVYIGAIVVLLLFGVMLTRAPIGKEGDLDNDQRWTAALVALFVLGALAAVLADAWGTQEIKFQGVQRTAAVSDSIFGTYVVPFEVASVLLLAALVGAVALARRD
jgi:NADH-quinone oxidoreductase subunit J